MSDNLDQTPSASDAISPTMKPGRFLVWYSRVSDELEEILHRDADPDSEDKTYVFETDRHYDIVKTLQLPDWAIGHGYTYLADGMFPDGFVVDDSFHTVVKDGDE